MANVRIFTYTKLISAELFPTSGRPSTDSVFLLREPYLGAELLSPTTGVAANSNPAIAVNETRLLKVQVDPGARVHYEVTPAGQDLRIATTNSPIMSGDDMFYFGAGFRISFLEAS